MYYTVTELIKLKIFLDKQNIDSTRIADLIYRDMVSPAKQFMAEGFNYYHSKNKILDKKRTYFVEGNEITDLSATNTKLPHPFFKILVDQKSSYIAGNPITIGLDEGELSETEQEDFQNALDTVLGNRFNKLMVEWITGAAQKGLEWLHFFIDGLGKLNFIIIPAEQIFPVFDTQYENRLIGIIRYYTYDYIGESGNLQKLNKVEWWTDKNVEYWEQEAGGTYIHDPFYDFNPGPHWYTYSTLSPSEKKPNYWGQKNKSNQGIADDEQIGVIPFIPLYNNSTWNTDLEPIKALVDAYDSVMSGWCDDLEDFQELILVVKGFLGLSEQAKEGLSELALFKKQLKTQKVINIDAQPGAGVESLKSEIPVEAKEKFLTIVRKEIFYFGQGIDSDNENIRSASSGVALQYLYAGLDMKSNKTIEQLQEVLPQFMWFLVYYINLTQNKNYDSSLINFTFNKSMIFNEAEKITSLNLVYGKISNQTFLENLPMIDDVQQEMERLKAEKEEAIAEAKVNLDNVPEVDAMGNPIAQPSPKSFDQSNQGMANA
jgi:SPP1 family phage portal protein